MFLSRRSILSAFAALPLLATGCSSGDSAPAAPAGPAAAADQERLQREALKNLGPPGAGAPTSPPPQK